MHIEYMRSQVSCLFNICHGAACDASTGASTENQRHNALIASFLQRKRANCILLLRKNFQGLHRRVA